MGSEDKYPEGLNLRGFPGINRISKGSAEALPLNVIQEICFIRKNPLGPVHVSDRP